MVSVESNLVLLVIYPIIFCILHKWPRSRVAITKSSRVGFFRRTAAIYIDMCVAGFGIFPLVCMPALIIEYLATGNWAWGFQRDYLRQTDVFWLIPSPLIIFFGIYYYSKWHFVNDKQTLGQHFLKFKLMPMAKEAQYSIRVLMPWITDSSIKALRVTKL